ncbi:MAG: hypothetical protein OXM01_17855 [Gemmatimonadota bacterium]|nr:hypothetical protein [Gemmatimonadota bacterium]
MTRESEKFRPIETAPEWSHEVFDTCAELADLLERHSYRFARTMPGAPHSYSLKRTWPSEGDFVEALRKMRSVERIEEFFRGYWYRRFNANGYKYWTMGASLDHILINRAIHAPPLDAYSAVCDSYDLAIHKGDFDVERSRRVYESLKSSQGPKFWEVHITQQQIDRLTRRMAVSGCYSWYIGRFLIPSFSIAVDIHFRSMTGSALEPRRENVSGPEQALTGDTGHVDNPAEAPCIYNLGSKQ